MVLKGDWASIIECNSTGTDMALFYFRTAIFGLPGYAICAGSHINNCKLKQGGRGGPKTSNPVANISAHVICVPHRFSTMLSGALR